MGEGHISKESKLSFEALFDERVAADLLNVKTKTLQAWRVRGHGPKFVKLGRAVRYRPGDLQEYVRSHLRMATRDAGPSQR